MTVTEAVTASGITPSADYKGIENTDDFVLAICTEPARRMLLRTGPSVPTMCGSTAAH